MSIYKPTIVTTGSTLIYTGVGILGGYSLVGGSDTATLTIYDNTTGSGTIVGKCSAVANTSFLNDLSVSISTGIYAVVTGAGAYAIVYVR